MSEYYTKQGYHITHIPTVADLSYVSCFFTSHSNSCRSLAIMHISEHILINIFRSLINSDNDATVTYQYAGAYTTKEYISIYTYDFSHIYTTIRVMAKFLNMIASDTISKALIEYYMRHEIKNIQNELLKKKPVVSNKIEQVLYNSYYVFNNDDINTITAEEILHYIRHLNLQVDIVIVGKLNPENLCLFDHLYATSDEAPIPVVSASSPIEPDNLHPFQIAIRLPKVCNTSDHLLAQAFQFYFRDKLKEQPCFCDLSISLKVLQQGEAYVYGEGKSQDPVCRIDESCVMLWIENINIFEFKKTYEEARYRMLLTLDHSDVQAMWAYKSYCFSGVSSTREDIAHHKLHQEEIREYTKRLQKGIKVIFYGL